MASSGTGSLPGESVTQAIQDRGDLLSKLESKPSNRAAKTARTRDDESPPAVHPDRSRTSSPPRRRRENPGNEMIQLNPIEKMKSGPQHLSNQPHKTNRKRTKELGWADEEIEMTKDIPDAIGEGARMR